MSIQPNERWYRVTLRNGSQSCMVLALGCSEQDAAQAVRDEITLYGAEIAHIEPVRERRVVGIG